MDSSRLAGVGFLVAGLVALFRFGVDPATTIPAVLGAVIGVGCCALGVLWLRNDVGTDTTRDGRRVPAPVAVVAAVVFFGLGVAAYVGV
ncbi:hypothetical protein [Halococcus agarilyticus]|uniref:hypothetical protein n=1 Tax=Halococcus agarilyticus TaxID=1232219 RepID=UPI000677D8E9|nr:hypothetical protein [Halococcus agarilyticus]